ncbi:DNA segregation ATPase FtsK/SpoIIIE, S-DNA-T family [Amycolatopsis sacchari]|uniref:DNA segregation ATPase FtsK/SpoIIIE, S-DNA-T family n=1 Tax=Amycolatopsis sacchari TaxID=115433 RepID=A0A1I3R5Z9_9PSEU|nr:FtsK/SpoIIIE domain-containing protein [Amycolatopsis sacchari]SFJ41480.1 DNA segregation ATPase FtsK/SpoIIIE, S-DNA-T family [Amycolatopsis sacchari]
MGTEFSKRAKGAEMKAAAWLGRHPGAVLTPAAVTASGVELGWTATGGILGGTAVGLGAWYRAHPDTFDRFAAPRMRAWRRRWLTYVGPRWRNALIACDLYTTHRKTGEMRVPRVVRVRSYSPSVDTVYVRLHPGQHLRQFEAKLPELTEALKVERIALERVKPRVLALVVERSEPFTEVIEAPEMPYDGDAVDLTDLYVGETEYGGEWRLPLLGQHIFAAGATGAGKNSVVASLLRGVAPLVRDGSVRLWLCDPKQMEFATLAGIAHRYADTDEAAAELVDEYVEDMQATQRMLAEQGQRKITPSPVTPLNLLVLDEMGALLAYGDASVARGLRRQLALVGSQGRATGHSMVGLVQEPTKDTVPVRDLFTTRICLRVTSAAHVDMVLGENARLRGALADEIPNDPATAGIGYVIRQRSRVPMRVRAAYVDDRELDEPVEFVRAGWRGGADLRVVA